MSNAARKFKPGSAERVEAVFKPNRRILVVDDEPSIASAYMDILSPKNDKVMPLKRSSRSAGSAAPATPLAEAAAVTEDNFAVTVVSSAQQALAAVQHSIQINQPFAMGFFDVLLGPGMDGIELVKKIYDIDPNIYAVFVTAYSDRTVDSIRGLLGEDKSSSWDYLNKPFTHGEILQKARGAISVWNLRAEKALKEDQIGEMQKRLLEHERTSAVATVSRSVTHEFGNVLMQILGRAELGRGKSDVDMRDALEKIYTASQRAADILKRFKRLSNAGVNDQSHQHPVQLNQPLEEAIELLSHQLKVGQIKVCRVKSAKPIVIGDSTALMQVFVNLIINSIHAMPHSGQIDVSIGEHDGMAEVKLRDYGPGVDPKLIDQVTEPFFTTKGANGSGLGLAICKDIVEKEHLGKLMIRNHEVKGFEVTVQIPLPPEPEPEEGSNG